MRVVFIAENNADVELLAKKMPILAHKYRKQILSKKWRLEAKDGRLGTKGTTKKVRYSNYGTQRYKNRTARSV